MHKDRKEVYCLRCEYVCWHKHDYLQVAVLCKAGYRVVAMKLSHNFQHVLSDVAAMVSMSQGVTAVITEGSDCRNSNNVEITE